MKKKILRILWLTFVLSLLMIVSVYAASPDELVRGWITDIASVSYDDTLNNSLTQTLKTFNYTSTTAVINIAKNTTFGIGTGLLSIFLLMDLIAIIQRMDGGGGSQSGINIPANFLIKFAIITFLYCKYNIIMEGIEAICVSISSSIGSTTVAGPFNAGAGLINFYNSLDFLQKAMCGMCIFLCWLVSWLMKNFVIICIAFRMFQMWLMTMFAPIPLATLPSNEFKGTAINFIKSYASVCLSGCIIMGTFKLYSLFMQKYITDVFSGLTDAKGLLIATLQTLVPLFILVGTIMGATRFSKSLLNAM